MGLLLLYGSDASHFSVNLEILMELLISLKHKLVNRLRQESSLTWVIGFHWSRSLSHRWREGLMVTVAASKAERHIMKVKAAGEEKEGWRCRLGRQGGVKWWKESPCGRRGQSSRPFLTAECTGRSKPCWWLKAVAMLSEVPLALVMSTLNLPTPMGSVTSLLGVFPIATLAQEI